MPLQTLHTMNGKVCKKCSSNKTMQFRIRYTPYGRGVIDKICNNCRIVAELRIDAHDAQLRRRMEIEKKLMNQVMAQVEMRKKEMLKTFDISSPSSIDIIYRKLPVVREKAEDGLLY